MGGGELVFLYGTLRRGGSNHFRIEEARFVGEAWVLGRLYRIDWYPGMMLDDEGIPVRGEVYEVESGALAGLDEFEGAEYERREVTVNLKDGGELGVWAYEYLGEVSGKNELVPADWMQVRPERAPSVFSLLTIALLPLTVGFGILSWWLTVPGPKWVAMGLEGVAVIAPLVPFLTARLARKRKESLAEGAEICAAIGLVFFGTALIVRYLPVAFGVFPN